MTFEELKKELPTIKQKIESGECSVVIIDGPQGPTGKTTAANFLRDNGVLVFEDWQTYYIRIGWMHKPKTSIMTWYEFNRDVEKICKMIKKGWYGYQAAIVGGTCEVSDAVELLHGYEINAYEEAKVLRFTLDTYMDRTSL